MSESRSPWGYGGVTRTVLTPWGKETYQVFIQRAEAGWIARIVTLPNRIWVQPGAREAVKFYGANASEAEGAAAAFMDEERVATGRRLVAASAGDPEDSVESGILVPPAPRAATRLTQRFLVRFGAEAPERPGVTGNLSESGLFIITDRPGSIGAGLEIDLRLPDLPLVLEGEIVWVNTLKRQGASLGCGIRLFERPPEYVKKLRDLIAVYGAD